MCKLDFVALSFVRSAKDLEEIKSIIDKSEHKPLLIILSPIFTSLCKLSYSTGRAFSYFLFVEASAI